MTSGCKSLVQKIYFDFYDCKASVIGISGRANLIGEHTDYNGGFVFPFAIAQKIYFAYGISQNEKFHCHSIDFNNFYVEEEKSEPGTWQFFFSHTIDVLRNKFGKLIPVNVVIGGDLPIGAGISSSSALCCGFVELFNETNQLSLTYSEKVNIASEIEHGSGVKGGKMDQYAIVFGKENKALLLDCQALTHHEHHIPKGWKFFLVNTGVKHNLVHTAYNERRQQCESTVYKLASEYKSVKSLRDVNFEMLNEFDHLLTKVEKKRALYVLEENERVRLFQIALEKEDIDSAGRLLNLSHHGLSKLYEVSCDELDDLQLWAMNTKGIYGCRMMGGGFGGCTINLCKSGENVSELTSFLQSKFHAKWGRIPEVIEIGPSTGIEHY